MNVTCIHLHYLHGVQINKLIIKKQSNLSQNNGRDTPPDVKARRTFNSST